MSARVASSPGASGGNSTTSTKPLVSQRPSSSSKKLLAISSTSAGKPLAISPASPPATSPTATGPSLTQKQWIVPPRPKPGRKPATDTPATKRKAQNRVAQRAFRERKAAKVGELEEQMDQLSSEHAAETNAVHAQMEQLRSEHVGQLAALAQEHAAEISALQVQAAHLNAEIERWRAAYGAEQRRSEELERDAAIARGEAVSLPRRRRNDVPPASYHTPEEIPLGCNKCSLTHCQCLEDALQGRYLDDSGTKRPLSPSSAHPGRNKRARTIPETDPGTANALDADDAFANEPAPDISDAPAAFVGGCGFCTEGSACLCAELAADDARRRSSSAARSSLSSHEHHESTNLPSPPSDSGPGEIDFTSSFTKPAPSSMHPSHPTSTNPASSSSCPDGPGSCTQCQRDPERALFCKTLAASRDSHLAPIASTPTTAPSTSTHPAPSSSTPIVPCPAGAACCRLSTTLATLSSDAPPRARYPRLAVPCAEAFNTLQRHPAFPRASRDIGAWLPQLATVPVGAAGGDGRAVVTGDAGAWTGVGDREAGNTVSADRKLQPMPRPQVPSGEADHSAFEIETASILGVLRFFDRRFGREA